MSRFGAMVAVAALLLGAFSGCTLDSANLNAFAASNEREQILSGSLESVVSATHDSLVKLKLNVNETKEGASIRLASTTPSGKRFSLVFTSIQSSSGPRTHVQVEWVDQADTTFWFQLVESVATASR